MGPHVNSKMADEHDEEQTIAQDLVFTKYKMAAEIVNGILKTLVSKSVAGAKILDLCEEGDKLLSEETIKVFKKEKEMKNTVNIAVLGLLVLSLEIRVRSVEPAHGWSMHRDE